MKTEPSRWIPFFVLAAAFLLIISCAGPGRQIPDEVSQPEDGRDLSVADEMPETRPEEIPEEDPVTDKTPVPAKQAMAIPEEIRGIWVTRWDYDSPDDIIFIMDRIAAAGLNTVFFQVRGRSDAFYQSSLEPWAAELTGILGQDPGWDPLEVAVNAAHSNGLAIHAWINTLTCWSGAPPPDDTDPQHIYHAHPEWFQINSQGRLLGSPGDYIFLCPANPAVRDHVTSVAGEIAAGYAIDGLHLDYIRYAGTDFSYDKVSRYRYVAENRRGLNRAEWQREELNELVRMIRDRLKRIDENLLFTAAVWGIYIDRWGWNSSQGYYNYYQDSLAWINKLDMDAVCPMTYWSIGGRPDFEALVTDFINNAGKDGILPGIKCDYPTFDEIKRQIALCREKDTRGFLLFAYSTLKEKNYWDDLTRYLAATAVTAETSGTGSSRTLP